MLYRLEVGKANDIYNVNRELGIQIGYLSHIARRINIPVIITNQIYADFEDKFRTNMVGGDLLKYQSKCLIELQKFKDSAVRKAILRKHRSIAENRESSSISSGKGSAPLIPEHVRTIFFGYSFTHISAERQQ